MESAWPRSSEDIIASHRLKYYKGVQEGAIVPYVYPLSTVGIAAVLVFLLIHPSNPLDTYLIRWMVFGFMAYLHIWIIIHCRSFNEVPTFGIGLLNATLLLWAATKLIFRDAKREFKRIESKTYVQTREAWWNLPRHSIKQNGALPAQSYELTSRDSSPPSLRKRSGSTDLKRAAQLHALTVVEGRAQPQELNDQTDKDDFFWQGYPSGPFIERLDWVFDLYFSFRGTGWNWLILGLPGPPANVQSQLKRSDPETTAKTYTSTNPVSRVGVPRHDTVKACIARATRLALKGYFVMDAFNTLATRDPYFWGIIDAPVPDFLPDVIRNSWALTRCYRLTIVMSIIWISLRTIFSLAPLFYVGVLGSELIGPRGEPWNYPDHYGSFSNIFTRGLMGWWGGWWHQTFRFMFESASSWTLKLFSIDKKSTLGKTISLFVSFGLSGLIHASGSFTQMGDTNPWSGPLLFFLLQPIGFALEMGWHAALNRLGLKNKIPRPVGYAANFVWVHAWMLVTAPLVADDFARGGILLYKPFPISIWRGLGFGAPGTGWWCWGGGRWVQWHSDAQGRWWLSGIAL